MAKKYGTLKINLTAGKGEDAQASECCELLAFSVVAGKYSGTEMNCKYTKDFATLDEAIAAFDRASDYHWCYMQYKDRVLGIYRKGFDIFER